jgi:hypothetical protein
MTEDEWLASEDADSLHSRLAKSQRNDRKTRLWAVGCCRRVWHLLNAKWLRRAAEIAEEFADGAITATELHACSQRAWDCNHNPPTVDAPLHLREVAGAIGCCTLIDLDPFPAVCSYILRALEFSTRATERETVRRSESIVQCHLLRCISGNPFRSVSFDPIWLTSTVVALARGIYDERAFDRMPILADALQDAGCEDATILDHCRGPGPHVRGCWVVDLILDKK